MGTQKVEVVMNIPDMKLAEKLMTNAFTELLGNRLNKLSVEKRKEICEEILKVINNNDLNNNK